MDNTQIQEYCRRYFQSTNSKIFKDRPHFLQVELPREIDKELTDRPYYWMWIEATNQEVTPTILNLVFQADTQVDDAEKTELVALGSFRLEKIFQSAVKRGQFVCQYQTCTHTNLRVPILLTSLKLSYIADRRKDEIRSYGVNLKSNQVFPELYEYVRNLPMTMDIPLQYKEQLGKTQLLKAMLQSGWQRIKETVIEEIKNSDHWWAEQAQEQLTQEIQQLETYYQSLILENQEQTSMYMAEKEMRTAELKWRCQPRIQIAPLHFALLYLEPTQLTETSERI